MPSKVVEIFSASSITPFESQPTLRPDSHADVLFQIQLMRAFAGDGGSVQAEPELEESHITLKTLADLINARTQSNLN
jgi:hypothetical protein